MLLWFVLKFTVEGHSEFQAKAQGEEGVARDRLNEYRVSMWGDKKVLELDSDAGCIAL